VGWLAHRGGVFRKKTEPEIPEMSMTAIPSFKLALAAAP